MSVKFFNNDHYTKKSIYGAKLLNNNVYFFKYYLLYIVDIVKLNLISSLV